MAEKLKQKQTVDFKELLMSEVIQSEALINLLDRKGVISKQELLEEMKRVQSTMIKSKKG
jgi:predicted nucleic acid-binding protein